MDDRRLFLLDAYALIYRAYYAMMRMPRVTTTGINTTAVMGFVNSLDEVLRKQQPSHIAVCFDPPHGHTFRSEAYEQYKAQREKQPEDITAALPWIRDILAAMNITMVMEEDYEADDVIGTLARRAQEQGFTTYMMTPDKDYAQLVTDRILQYKPSYKGNDVEIRGPQQVREHFGVPEPVNVIDLLALQGDASDNIPGCPGVGDKTAVRLINEYGTAEDIIAAAPGIKGKLGERIAANAEQILFSKFLATIKTDIPALADTDIDTFALREPDYDALLPIYEKLEFRSFIKRLKASVKGHSATTPASEAETHAKGADGMASLFDFAETSDTENDALAALPAYTVVSTPAEAAGAVSRAIAAGSTGLAVAAAGAEAMTARLDAIALAPADGGEAVAIPLPADRAGRVELIGTLKPLFAAGGPRLVAHDIKRIMVMALREGIDPATGYFDTEIAHYLIEPEMKHAIGMLARRYLGITLPEPEAGSMDEAVVTAIAARDLEAPLAAGIDEAGLRRLLDEVELPLARVLAGMEYTGVRIDAAELHRLSKDYTERLHGLEEQVYDLAGVRFNIGSPSQVGDVLFRHLKIDPKAKTTKKGSFSTTEEILAKYAAEWPIVDLILQIRGLRKLLSTYINALPALVNPATGKIHTTYNQTVTATGRISSANPNLQNIPVRSDDGREIRRAFIPDPGNLFMSADYSQIELRLMADLSGDPDMIAAFAAGEDIHRTTASKVFHTPVGEVTDDQRRKAKTANFGIIYGISAFGLSERLKIPRAEAKALIDGYFHSYPHIAEYIGNAIKKAREEGYVTTIMGRRRMLPDIDSRNATVRSFAERNAVNAPIQGSAADIIKLAMVRIARRMEREGMRSRMIMQVHDELIFNVVPAELPALQDMVMAEMAGAYSGRVRLEVAAGVADNWLEAH